MFNEFLVTEDIRSLFIINSLKYSLVFIKNQFYVHRYIGACVYVVNTRVHASALCMFWIVLIANFKLFPSRNAIRRCIYDNVVKSRLMYHGPTLPQTFSDTNWLISNKCACTWNAPAVLLSIPNWRRTGRNCAVSYCSFEIQIQIEKCKHIGRNSGKSSDRARETPRFRSTTKITTFTTMNYFTPFCIATNLFHNPAAFYKKMSSRNRIVAGTTQQKINFRPF